MPPRVAILPPVPVPYREPLFARLAERGRVSPRVIYLSGAQPGWDMRADWFPDSHSYESEVLRAWQRPRAGRTPVTVPRGLGASLRAAAPDCVVSWEYGPATLRALGWCAPRRRPLVIFSELTPGSDAELSPPQLRLHRLVAPRAAGFVVASSQGVERLERMGVDRARVEVSLQAADLTAFRSAAMRREPSSAGPVRVLCVGRLVPDKNLGTLLEAFTLAGFAEGEAELALCGEGPLEGELRAQAARLGASVRFLGFAGTEELPAVYADADVLGLVSTYEPFGVTMREGAAAGLPLVCTRTAGAAGDVAVDGENALLVDPHDRRAIADALRRLVREPDLRERLAAGSRAVTERHPLEADVEAWERAVLRASAQKGR
ncbi:MAG TPA: glycosyltransferase family 4 protein [Thermoleophilaceae bacterium]|jgi:glycosyltransferase involved in cell wall biosynthesis